MFHRIVVLLLPGMSTFDISMEMRQDENQQAYVLSSESLGILLYSRYCHKLKHRFQRGASALTKYLVTMS